MSLKIECRSKYNVTQIEFHSKNSVTQNEGKNVEFPLFKNKISDFFGKTESFRLLKNI